jgi:hypothetical protein
MMTWTLNRIIVPLLGLWIAIAPALLAVPAAGLTLQMSMVDDADPDHCGCCSDAKPNRDLCASMCVTALPFATLRSDDLVAIAFHDDYALGRELTRSSRKIPPDPPPPRSFALR